MDFNSMKRKELQSLCKKHGIPANLTNLEMAARLAELHKVEQQKKVKSCLKNSEIVVASDDEVDRVDVKGGGKRVKFSPESETFLFEKTDPREMRLLARKRRNAAKSGLEKESVLISKSLSSAESNLVDVCENVGDVDVAVGRNLRRKSIAKPSAKEKNPGGNLVDECENGGGVEVAVGRNLRRKLAVKLNSGGISNVENPAEEKNPGRNLRSRRGKVEGKDFEVALLAPCVEKRARRGKKIGEILEGDVVDEGKNLEAGLLAPCVEKKTRRSKKGGEILEGDVDEGKDEAGLLAPCVEKRVRRGKKGGEILQGDVDEGKDLEAGLLAPSAEKKTRRGKKGCEISEGDAVVDEGKDLEVALLAPCVEKKARRGKKGGEVIEVDVVDVNQDVAKNPMDGGVELALDNRKRKRAGRNAANTKHQPCEKVADGALDQQNGNVERPLDDKAFVGRRQRGRKIAVEGLGKEDITGDKVSVGERVTRRNLTRAKNDEIEGSSVPVQPARRSTRQAGKVKVNASLSVKEADDEGIPKVVQMNQIDNKKAPPQLMNEASEATGSVVEKVGSFTSDCSSHEQAVTGDACSDDSIAETMKHEVEFTVVDQLDYEVVEQEEAASGSMGVLEGSYRETEHITEVFDCLGTIQYVSEDKTLVGYEPNTDSKTQHSPLSVNGSTLLAEVSLTTACELIKEDKDTKPDSLLHNHEAETSGRSTEKINMHENTDGSKDMPQSISTVDTTYVQSQVDGILSGELTDVLGLSKKIEGSSEEPVGGLACSEHNCRQDCLVESDKFIVSKDPELAENSADPKLSNLTFEDDATIPGELDDEVMEQEEAAPRESEWDTPEVSDCNRLNQFVSEDNVVVGDEPNLDANSQHPTAEDGLTSFAEFPHEATCEVIEEDKDIKPITPLHSQDAGTCGEGTETSSIRKNKDGGQELSESVSTVDSTLNMQSHVDGELTVVLGLSEKESFEETFRDFASSENSGRWGSLVEDDKFTASKEPEVAENTAENNGMESEEATVGTDKDVENVVNELSQCTSPLSDEVNDLHNAHDDIDVQIQVDTATQRETDCETSCNSPFSAQKADHDSPKVDSEIDQEEADADTDVKMQADAASLGEAGRESSCNSPFSAQKTDHDSLKVHCETDQAEGVNAVYCAALESQSHSCNEKLTDEIEESLRDASEVRCLSLLEGNAGTKEVTCASEESQHGEMITTEDAGMTESHDLPQEKPENPQNSRCVIAEVSDALVNPGMFSTEEMETTKLNQHMAAGGQGWQGQYHVTLGSGSAERKKEKFNEVGQICPNNNVTGGAEDCISSNDNHEEAPPANVNMDVAGFDDSLENIISPPTSINARKFSVSPSAEKFAGTDLGAGNIGSEKVVSVERERLYEDISNEKLSKQMSALEKSPGVNEGCGNENAIEYQMLDRGAAVVHNIDDRLIEQEVGIVSRERCETISGEAECGFEVQGLDQCASQEKIVGNSEADFEHNAQRYTTVDQSSLYAEAFRASMCELMEEDDEAIKAVTPLHNREAEASGNTEEPKADESKYNSGFEVVSDSIVGDNLHQQSHIEGNVPNRLEEELDALPCKLTNAEEKSPEASMNDDTSDTPGDSGVQRLFTSTIGETGANELCRSPSSLIEREISIQGHHKIDQVEAQESFYPAMFITPPSGRSEKLVDGIEGASHDASEGGCASLYDSSGKTKYNVTGRESTSMSRGDYSASERRKVFLSLPFAMAAVSDVVNDHGKMDKFEEVEVDGDCGSIEDNCGIKFTDHPVAHDVCNSAMVVSPSSGRNDKAIDDNTEGGLDDGLHVGFVPLLEGSHGARKDDVAPREIELGEERNAEDARISRSTDIASESQNDLLDSSCGAEEVSDVSGNAMVDESEEADGNTEQGKMNGGQLDDRVMDESSAYLTNLSASKWSVDVSEPVFQDAVNPETSEQINALEKNDDQLIGQDEANFEPNAQHYSNVDQSALYEEAFLASMRELMEEDDEATKTDTPLHNREAEANCNTEEPKMEGSKYNSGFEDVSDSNLGNNLHLQSHIEGDVLKSMEEELDASPCKLMNAEEISLTASRNDATDFSSGERKYNVTLRNGELGELKFSENTSTSRCDHSASERRKVFLSLPFAMADVSDVVNYHGKMDNSKEVEVDGVCPSVKDNCSTESTDHTVAQGVSEEADVNTDQVKTEEQQLGESVAVIDHCPKNVDEWPCKSANADEKTSEGSMNDIDDIAAGKFSENIMKDETASTSSAVRGSPFINDSAGTSKIDVVLEESKHAEVNDTGDDDLSSKRLRSSQCSPCEVAEVSDVVIIEHAKSGADQENGNGNGPRSGKDSDEFPEVVKDFRADSKTTKSSAMKRNNSRSILIHGTPKKLPVFIHDMKENDTGAGKAACRTVDVTAVRPMLKRKPLEDIRN